MNNIYSQPEQNQPVQPQSRPSKVSPLIATSFKEMIGVGFVGALVGLALFGLLYLLNNYVFGLLLCRDASQICQAAPTISMAIASIVSGLAGLGVLAKMNVYRPLLVVLAAAVALWSIYLMVAGMTWYWGLVVCMVLFALAYVLFTWLVRIRSFIIAIILAILIILLVRFSMIS